MLDVGLLVTGAVIVGVLMAATRWAPTRSFELGEVIDRLIVPAVVGLLAARVAAAALDDRASLRSVRALLVIRGGVEFWVGATVMLALIAAGMRRRGREVRPALAELAPFVLWGYAAYEATCVLRDGCYGPASPVGLVPDGLQTRMLPLGLLAAGAIVVLGFVIRHLAWSASSKLLLAVGGVAGLRALVSFWLPQLGDGLTRQHRESIVVAAGVVAIGAVRTVTWRRAAGPTGGSVTASLPPSGASLAPGTTGERP